MAAWLLAQPLAPLLTDAVHDSIQYVLDGARTGRFDLDDPEVDTDERSTVGTKMQYRIINALNLVKARPLDTHIQDVPVDIKGTVAANWSIPREAQCELCLLVKVEAKQDRFRAYLMRTHRVWLNGGQGNGDRKRGVRTEPLNKYAIPLLAWTPLPRNPLKSLTDAQRLVVFSPYAGQVSRLTSLFGYLPNVVIPRHVILTVGANREDPLRRARQAKDAVLQQHGLRLLCGKWPNERAEAARLGFDLGTSSWVAVY